MSRTLRRSAIAVAVLAAGVTWYSVKPSGQGYIPSTKNGDWTHYTADVHGTKYSPLDQVTAQNFNKLEVAWRFKTDNLGTRPEYKLEGTPLAIKGVLYVTAGTRRSVIALDGRTGELIWSHSYREGTRAAIAPRQLSGRGVSYWTDGKGDERILYVTTGYRMIALNAKTGAMIPSFGENGVVDLKKGAMVGKGTQIDLEQGEIGLHSTPTVVKDVVIVGSSFKEGMTVVTHNNTKGLVRAFDVKSGKLLWTFNTIPRPGELGNDTWENESWAQNGNTGVWTQITVDEERGLVYLPVETPTSDFYGGHRPGNNLFAESLVCVDLKTGQRKWHFQYIHHGIWDHDNSSAAMLTDVVKDGKVIPAVASPSKQGYVYLFNRVTGEPIYPIVETPVPASDVPGEKAAPTQPIPQDAHGKPWNYARDFIHVPDDIIDYTPALRAEALENLKRYRVEQSPYVPLVLGDVNGKYLGTLNHGNTGGGTNWPGGGLDPETHIFYSQANTAGVTTGSLREPPPEFKTDIKYVSGVKGREFRIADGPGFGSAADAPQRGGGAGGGRGAEAPAATTAAPAGGAAAPAAAAGGGRGGAGGPGPQGLPLVKPPYGVMAAVNLDKGEIMWRVPHGDTPDTVRNHPALKGLTIPKTGQNGSVGVLVTKTLVIAADPQVTTTPDHPRGAMLRAYNKQTGEQVGAVWMPAQVSGSPMTYKGPDGRQYIVIAISGGNYSGEYLSFALPQTEGRPSTQQ
jgi:glucose dehydrogenase